jgi:hypothetical protein
MAPKFSAAALQKALVTARANSGIKKKPAKVSIKQIKYLRKVGESSETIMAEVSC